MKIKTAEWIFLARALEVGLKSGRGPVTSLTSVLEICPHQNLCDYINHLLAELRTGGLAEVIQLQKEKSLDQQEKIFLEVLSLFDKGVQKIHKTLQEFRSYLTAKATLERRLQAALFVPRAQILVSTVILLFFTLVMPNLVGAGFPTFLELGRTDLYLAGWALIVLGLLVVMGLCQYPRRRLSQCFHRGFFFQFVLVYLESGRDFETSWKNAVALIPFSQSLEEKLVPAETRTDEFKTFLLKTGQSLRSPWPEYLTSLCLVVERGVSVKETLELIVSQEKEYASEIGEGVISKTSFLSLLPLGGLVFPATLYLLLGPQLMQLMEQL